MRERWRGDLHRFQEEVNRLVEQSLNRIGNYWTNDGDIKPAADLYDYEQHLLIFVELPGIAKADITVALTGRTLTVTAQKERPEVDETLLVKGERHFGTCRRSFDLTCDVDVEKIDATLTDGILCLNIPKTQSTAQKIEIKIG